MAGPPASRDARVRPQAPRKRRPELVAVNAAGRWRWGLVQHSSEHWIGCNVMNTQRTCACIIFRDKWLPVLMHGSASQDRDGVRCGDRASACHGRWQLRIERVSLSTPANTVNRPATCLNTASATTPSGCSRPCHPLKLQLQLKLRAACVCSFCWKLQHAFVMNRPLI